MNEEVLNVDQIDIDVDEKLKKTIAENLVYYRKINNITQAKLAELLSYSDKAVSKWERGDGVPDIYILNKLASIYHITVNDLVYEHKEKKPIRFVQNKLVISLLSVGLVWLVAIVFFTLLAIINSNIEFIGDKWHLWYLFIYAIPETCIVSLIFSKIWGKRWHRFFEVSGIVWGVGLVVYLQMKSSNVNNAWIFWLICATLEILVILWYCLRRKKKEVD